MIFTARRIPIPAKMAFAGGNGYINNVKIARQRYGNPIVSSPYTPD